MTKACSGAPSPLHLADEGLITWAHTHRSDVREFRCFETFAVFRGPDLIGFIQCKGPCRGIGAERGHRHGPWISLTGIDSNTALNLQGVHAHQGAAANAVAEAVRQDDRSAAAHGMAREPNTSGDA